MKGFLIAIIVLMFLAGMMVLAYSLFGSIAVTYRLTNTTELMAEENPLPNIGISKVRYYNATEELCGSENSTDIVIADLIYDVEDIPGACEILVDSRFEKRVSIPKEHCDNCSYKLSVDLKRQDIAEHHTIELCCDGACTRKRLKSLC
jgi:hypothetical protein